MVTISQTRSTARNFADRARGLAAVSASPGTTGLFVRTFTFWLQPHWQTSARGGHKQARLQ